MSTYNKTSWDGTDTQQSEVAAALDPLKTKKAPGPDLLNGEILKAMGSIRKDACTKYAITSNILRYGLPTRWNQ